MDTTKIEAILKALELGSLTKAAEELQYSPSALSQMVNSIESEIGCRIINRKYTGIDVAEGKDDIIKRFREMIELKNQILRLADSTAVTKNTITLATYASISRNLLPDAIRSFEKLYPNTRINIIVVNNLSEIYASKAADVFFGEKIKNNEFVWKPIFTEPYLAILPESFGYDRPVISCSELLSKNFILAKDRKLLNYINKNIPDYSITSHSNDDSSIIELVKAGMCVSILPRLTVHNVSGIQTVPVTPSVKRDIGFTYNKAALSEKKHLKALIEYLAEYTKNVIE